jgi:hypothetical protein
LVAGLVAASFYAVLMSAWMCITTVLTARHTLVAIVGRQLLDIQQTFYWQSVFQSNQPVPYVSVTMTDSTENLHK